jgi:hypothetical protein
MKIPVPPPSPLAGFPVIVMALEQVIFFPWSLYSEVGWLPYFVCTDYGGGMVAMTGVA